ncbi:hypothetical protein BpHYR1_008589 [Brachionus plicatilis]|uniref:Uncharacterized protein n=1 Tax=Brachionus plicatilis TaxID=10195 RepID=A0A3M7PND5_BRAPC|nr:hypothetical protein BpHYR1_008589 [Brachionus plicatilis]
MNLTLSSSTWHLLRFSTDDIMSRSSHSDFLDGQFFAFAVSALICSGDLKRKLEIKLNKIKIINFEEHLILKFVTSSLILQNLYFSVRIRLENLIMIKNFSH